MPVEEGSVTFRAAAALGIRSQGCREINVQTQTHLQLQLHPVRGGGISKGRVRPLVHETYRSISSLSEDPLTGFGGQRLGAGDDAIGAVNDTPAAWKRHELWVRGRVYGFGIQRHDSELTNEGKILSVGKNK